jgi:hypothetical protein
LITLGLVGSNVAEPGRFNISLSDTNGFDLSEEFPLINSSAR